MVCEVETLSSQDPRWQAYQETMWHYGESLSSWGSRFRMTSVKIKTSFIQPEVAVSSLARSSAAAATRSSRLYTRNIYFRLELTNRSQSLDYHPEDSTPSSPSSPSWLRRHRGQDYSCKISFLYLFSFCLVETNVYNPFSALFDLLS